MNLNCRIILGSKSPRRRELLEQVGFQVHVHPLDIEESYPGDIPERKIAEYLANKKGAHFHGNLKENDVLICADTVVICHSKIMEKPLNRKEAFQMLRKLSGGDHLVTTGVFIKTNRGESSFSENTKVTFAQLSDEELYYYIDNFKPYDKAGAYGIQEWIGMIGIERIEGSYYNVVGLPIHKVYNIIMDLMS